MRRIKALPGKRTFPEALLISLLDFTLYLEIIIRRR